MEENLKQLPVNPEISDIIKIAIYGPESTGKTTLAKQLAGHFHTVWAPEFARDFLQEKWDDASKICEPSDIMPIAIGQTALENEMLPNANKFLFSDTCLLQTKVYSEIYYGECDPLLDKAARKHKYDLFFLTDVDVPWEADDLRDKPEGRDETFETFRKALAENHKPFIVLSGDAETRFHTAVSILENLELAKRLGFTSHDFIQIHKYGIPVEAIENHLNVFKKGMSKAMLERAASTEDGIIKLDDDQFNRHAAFFDQAKPAMRIEKFIPASGAASRMFKFLNEFLNDFDSENETINAFINRKDATALNIFLAGKEKFPFFELIMEKLASLHPDSSSWDSSRRNYEFIRQMLEPEYFDFCSKPKGVLPFHKYGGHIATAIEEHMKEAVNYAVSGDNTCHLHFTVSDIHRGQFEDIIASVRDMIERQSGTRIFTSFSYQNRATDTIAVDANNIPFRDHHGKLVFRPGGHGALIENLDRIDADVIFIKNIDNVIQDHVETISLYKKALAGLMLGLQEEIFSCLRQIENNSVREKEIDEIIGFITSKLNMEITEDFPKYTLANKREYIAGLLNRPVRVCGMVKNEGEPGGGPFWVRNIKGILSLQIIEASQVDVQNEYQEKILASSTHFNPVDLVCGVRNYKGEKFALSKFIDHESGFIVSKTKNGRPLKAYELPGLWNGAMAKWITVFVEVPLITFNPVKTVNDLLKPAHQPHL